jgi:hypothetical protein
MNMSGDEKLRFWPQKKWKKIMLSTILIVLVAFVGVGAYFEYSVYREVSLPIDTLNAAGAKTALMIYHSGLTDFAKNVTYSFADGLVSAGWRVDVATASPSAPTSLADYSMLVLVWPIYDFNPAPTITGQVHSFGNLNGMNTTIICIGGGLDPLNAKASMEKIVQDANGTIIEKLVSFRGMHNQAAIQQEATTITP